MRKCAETGFLCLADRLYTDTTTMPTVVSSRALVPIGRRIPNALEDSDASRAVVLRRKQDGEDLSKALIIIRPADDGKDDRQALVLYRQRGGQEALKEMARTSTTSELGFV